MTSPLPTTLSHAAKVARVRVIGFTGQDTTHELPAGDALVIGCSPACGLQLNGPGIAGLHCTISFDERGLTIEDWDTEIGTFVNGERIPSRLEVACGAKLKIGDYYIETELACSDPVPEEQTVNAPLDIDQDEDQQSSTFLTDVLQPELVSMMEEAQPSSEPPQQSDEELDDAGIWDSPFDDSSDMAPLEHDAYVHDGLGNDPEAALQVEVEMLRAELAERDACLSDVDRFVSPAESYRDESLPSREEVEALVERLEQLLEELDQSDERISTMSELLRVSDEANVASQEERVQMETWIGEVERRVRQWEEEWHAEREVMEKTIADLTIQRDRAESSGGSADQSQIIQELREHVSTLQGQLQQLQSEKESLNERVEAVDVSSVEEQVSAAVESALREERLQMSQTKAEYARERAELARQREDLVSSATSEPDVADVRIRAFREHLKEVRATEPAGRPTPSLSDRLGKLWRKIDGKPLDTD